MLPVLKQAGVVDSGGMGLMVVFRGAVRGPHRRTGGSGYHEAAPAQVMPGEFVDDHESLEEITFGYCTEFIVSHPRPDMRDKRSGAAAQAAGAASATACWSSATFPW